MEYLKLGPAPWCAVVQRPQGLQIVVKGRTDKYSDREVIATRSIASLPIVKSMNELLEPGI